MMNTIDEQLAKKIIFENNSLENDYLMREKRLGQQRKFLGIMTDIQLWEHYNKIRRDVGFYVLRDELSKLLGLSPLFHMNLEGRNAVWGLNWGGHAVVVLFSLRGIEILVGADFPNELSEDLLWELHGKLNCGTKYTGILKTSS